MGVWIETFIEVLAAFVELSHPVWVCGLKRAYCVSMHPDKGVTPCMGVWIETASHFIK